MLASRLHALLAIIPLITAQTWPGFVPRVPRALSLELGGHTVSRGELFENSAEVRFEPRIRVRPSDPLMRTAGRWLFIMLDSDVPVNSTRTSYLHWIANADKSGSDDEYLLLSTSDGAVRYSPPTPPAGDSPHRYSALLYDRPANFSLVEAMPHTDWDSYRLDFNLEDFLSETGLTLALGATYFRVSEPLARFSEVPIFPPQSYTMGPKVDGTDGWWSESGGAALRGGFGGVLLIVGMVSFLMD